MSTACGLFAKLPIKAHCQNCAGRNRTPKTRTAATNAHQKRDGSRRLRTSETIMNPTAITNQEMSGMGAKNAIGKRWAIVKPTICGPCTIVRKVSSQTMRAAKGAPNITETSPTTTKPELVCTFGIIQSISPINRGEARQLVINAKRTLLPCSPLMLALIP